MKTCTGAKQTRLDSRARMWSDPIAYCTFDTICIPSIQMIYFNPETVPKYATQRESQLEILTFAIWFHSVGFHPDVVVPNFINVYVHHTFIRFLCYYITTCMGEFHVIVRVCSLVSSLNQNAIIVILETAVSMNVIYPFSRFFLFLKELLVILIIVFVSLCTANWSRLKIAVKERRVS